MPLHLTEPWLRCQPRIRHSNEVLVIRAEVSWDPEQTDALQLSVEVRDLIADELLSLRVSSVLRRDELAPAFRLLTDESLSLIRRSGNPFDDLC